jgi:glycosyltransferase involved in cell wall biosynthesis
MSEQTVQGGERTERVGRPLVTIVTPSFNQGRFVERTILSVLEQDYPLIEYLVMDGGSTDQTLEILQKYSNRLAFVSEKDRGQAHAINKGFMRAHGDILAFLNSDDTYLPGAVSAAVEGLQGNRGAPFLYGEAHSIDEAGEILDRYPTEPFSFERLHETCFICQPAVFVARSAIEQAGYLDEDLNYCLDYEWWIRLSRLGQPAYIKKYLANTRVYATTKTLGQRRQFHWEIARMWKRVEGRVPSAWVFALAHAIIEVRFKLDRTKPRQDAVFVLALSALSTWLFFHLNQEIQREEAQQILGWVRAALRSAGASAFTTG